MPLVKRIQDKFGPDKLQVLLLSVDKGYEGYERSGSSDQSLATKNAQRMHKQQVDWPNVLLPHGFDDAQRRFNLDGYGLTLIGPDGIVRGVDVQPGEVERLLGGMSLAAANDS
jgi:hypothetical protein